MSQPDPTPRRRLLVGLILVALAVVAGLAYTGRLPIPGLATNAAGGKGGSDGGVERVTPVRTALVQVADFPTYVEGLGSAAAVETILVKTLVDGHLDRMSFTEGQLVKKGAVIAQIDPRPFTIALHNAEAALARDEANLEGASKDLDRYVALASKKLIPDQQRDDQSATVGQLKATIMVDKTAIETAQLNLDYSHITSPTDGVTGVRIVDPGNVVHASDPNGLVYITKLDPIALLITLPEDDLPEIAEAILKGPVKVQAFNRDGSDLLAEGTILLIDNQINASTATMRVKALLPNRRPDCVPPVPGAPDAKKCPYTLWPNQFVRARIDLSVKPQAKVAPAAALQTGPSGPFVYVVDPEKVAHTKLVKVDIIQGDSAVISSGLEGGEVVVIDGQNQLRPGAKVSYGAGGGGSGSDSGHAPATAKGGGESGSSGGEARAGRNAGVR